ncbi:MAG TPA: histidine kinase, partial [Mycobacteriales bacterium]|nr:histidine kinase [Mycobacteriales bacterium]
RFVVRGGRDLGTPAQRTTYDTLHTANLAAPALRTGLTHDSADRAIGALRRVLGTRAAALADVDGVLAADGLDDEHATLLTPVMVQVLHSGQARAVAASELGCEQGAACRLRAGVVVPLEVDGAVIGTLAALDETAPAGLLRLVGEVARFVSTQLALAELDASRRRAAQAELRFLRAQISPHFVYNALTAIESFVRSDPDRARELLVEFADFIRYSFRGHGQFASMAEELRLVDTYLDLERARFGNRLSVTLRVAPEALGVHLPVLILQPLVENAIRHGLEGTDRPGLVEITIQDEDSVVLITVEDDGAGMEPAGLRQLLEGEATDAPGVGLRNVDERLRAVYGDDYGLVVETAVGAGTKVSLRVPKSRPGGRA